MGETVLSVENLVKSYGGLIAVDGVTFKLQEETITGLIGPNGAGKTTLFNLVSGFESPDSGSIELKDQELGDIMSPDKHETSIGILSSTIVGGSLGGAAIALMNTPGIVTGSVVLLSGGIGGVAYLRGRELPIITKHQQLRPYQVARSGLIRTFQLTRELDGMSVLDNMLLAPQGQSGENVFHTLFNPDMVKRQEEAMEERAWELLETLEIEHLANDYAASLSGGQRKLLELGRILMANPDLILLDEPVASVNPTLTNKIMKMVEKLRAEGHTFFIIEHDMETIMDASDSIIVLNNGKKLIQGPPDEVQASDKVIEAYLGG